MVNKGRQAWAGVALLGGVILAVTSADSFQAGASAGVVIGGGVSLLLGLGLVVSVLAVAHGGNVSGAALAGLLGAAVYGWQFLALSPVETAVLGGSIGLLDLLSTVSALAALVGTVGVCLSTDAFRSATWASLGEGGGRGSLALVVIAAFASVIALFLPYAVYRANARNPAYPVDAWHYFGGITATMTLILALTCGTLAALQLVQPRLPYRWPLACLGLATLAFVFTPAEFGSRAQTGQAISLDVGYWLLLTGTLIISLAGVVSWRRSVAARGGR